MTGTIFLTGGVGKTSSRIAFKLQSLNIPVLLSSRRGQAGIQTGFKAVKFDWYDEATHVHPFDEDKTIEAVYIVIPDSVPTKDPVASVKQFVDLAQKKGVNKFVLMSGITDEKGDQAWPQDQIHAYLETIGVDYAVLKPSFFFGNFLYRWPSIKTNDEITSAAGDGKTGFISEDDIADIAVQFLTSPKLGGVEPIIVGPESLSYDQIAEQLSQVLGRKITHRKVSVEERKSSFMAAGLPDQLAGMLASSEADFYAAGGEEKIISEKSDKAIGKIRFVEFAEANKAVWQK